MISMDDLPKRKPNRLEDFDYASPGAYFITICTTNREKMFWSNVGADIIRPQDIQLSMIGRITEQAILQIPDHYGHISVDKYCIMPDHIHLILYIESEIDGRIISAPTVSIDGQRDKYDFSRKRR